MTDSTPRQRKIIDEDGIPVVDAAGADQRTGAGNPFGAAAGNPFGGTQGSPFGAPGFAVFTPDSRFMTADGRRPSLLKMLGWRGVAFLVGLVAIVIALAVVSLVAFAIVVPVLLVIGLIGAGVNRLRRPSRSTAIVQR